MGIQASRRAPVRRKPMPSFTFVIERSLSWSSVLVGIQLRRLACRGLSRKRVNPLSPALLEAHEPSLAEGREVPRESRPPAPYGDRDLAHRRGPCSRSATIARRVAFSRADPDRNVVSGSAPAMASIMTSSARRCFGVRAVSLRTIAAATPSSWRSVSAAAPSLPARKRRRSTPTSRCFAMERRTCSLGTRVPNSTAPR